MAASEASTLREPPNQSRVPLITPWFWILTTSCATVGEETSDAPHGSTQLGLAFVLTAVAILALVLAMQFRSGRYTATIYWPAALLASVVGARLSDLLSDSCGKPLVTTVLAICLSLTALAWWRSEGTLSIRSITTARREAFYWSAALITFAFGASFSDYFVDGFSSGLWSGLLFFGDLLLLVAISRYGLGIDAVVTFWAAYALTQPFGAGIGEEFSGSRAEGGLGVGVPLTSAAVLSTVGAVILFLALTRRDEASTCPGAGLGGVDESRAGL